MCILDNHQIIKIKESFTGILGYIFNPRKGSKILKIYEDSINSFRLQTFFLYFEALNNLTFSDVILSTKLRN